MSKKYPCLFEGVILGKRENAKKFFHFIADNVNDFDVKCGIEFHCGSGVGSGADGNFCDFGENEDEIVRFHFQGVSRLLTELDVPLTDVSFEFFCRSAKLHKCQHWICDNKVGDFLEEGNYREFNAPEMRKKYSSKLEFRIGEDVPFITSNEWYRGEDEPICISDISGLNYTYCGDYNWEFEL